MIWRPCAKEKLFAAASLLSSHHQKSCESTKGSSKKGTAKKGLVAPLVLLNTGDTLQHQDVSNFSDTPKILHLTISPNKMGQKLTFEMDF